MGRQPVLSALIVLAAAGLSSAAAGTVPALSWGKPGVSFEDYRADATSCLREAAGTDLTGSEPANALVLASRQTDAVLATELMPIIGNDFDPFVIANAMQRTRIGARPDVRFRQARDILQARLDNCLEGHGYRRFRLTDAQRRQLNRFNLRQPERQVYLHRLASDPQILASQSVAADISSPGR